ncbi:MAG: hypothetical protein AAGE92_08535 [Cyanobacteria bacterium P01_G01_bin.4]
MPHSASPSALAYPSAAINSDRRPSYVRAWMFRANHNTTATDFLCSYTASLPALLNKLCHRSH